MVEIVADSRRQRITDIPTFSEDMTEEQIQEMNDLIDNLW